MSSMKTLLALCCWLPGNHLKVRALGAALALSGAIKIEHEVTLSLNALMVLLRMDMSPTRGCGCPHA
jgi:hypothetical protein